MTATEIAATGFADIDQRSQLRRAVIASTIGTTIEWYDFLLYSTVTGLVFAKLYFPQSDPLIGTMQAYAIFFVGFIARPIGAVVFGHYGDRIGRKAALIATLLLTGLATFAVALVPSYAQIGIWGAIIMILLRFVQGSESAANGAAPCCCRWSGRKPMRIAALSRPGRNLARRLGCSSQISRSCFSAGFQATSF